MDSDAFYIVLGWLLLATIAGVYARKKGHPGLSGFFGGLFFPVLVFIVIAVMRTNQKELDARDVKSGISRYCTSCGSVVPFGAVVCRFCGRDLPPVKENGPAPKVTGFTGFRLKPKEASEEERERKRREYFEKRAAFLGQKSGKE